MQNESQIIKLKRDKLKKIKEIGIDPYPPRAERTHKINYLHEHKEKLLNTKEQLTITGRITAMRRHGKIGFADIEDMSGRIQLYVRSDALGAENYEVFKLCDMGDFIEAAGQAVITQRGEYSLLCSKIKMLTKSLRPVPAVKEKVVDGKKIRYDEFTDIELRYRRRYLDLLLNPEIKETFIKKARLIKTIRDILDDEEYIEVETPILQPIYGGAYARPFVTHHNTLNIDLYLRIATELYLKRLIVGGFEKVYEIGKDFRNEGMDRQHNPEFTMLELYEAYGDYHSMMEIAEKLINQIALNLTGSETIEYDGHSISFARPFTKKSMPELIKEKTGLDVSDLDADTMIAYFKEKGIELPENPTAGNLIIELFEAFVEDKLIQPTFVTDFPKEVSPLAKSKKDNPELVERFELFIAGQEIGNAFTELNDPLDQEERLKLQEKMREPGDTEASPMDDDFLLALQYGMPPTGGLGIGLERLTMLFTNNKSIKEVILFPQMKPEHK